jgi:uncharacterized protein YcnI
VFRRGLVASAVATLVLLIAVPASAHVTIQPPTATRGGFATEAFQVPNERSDANTVKLEVEFPADHPIAFVSVEPVPGWTVKVEKSTLAKPIKSDDGDVTEAVSKITWSGGQILPGNFQRFPVSMGPLPDVASLEFKAAQTYSNGEVVRWVEPRTGGAEPEHPAPMLTLTKAAETDASKTVSSSKTTVVVPKNVATSDDVDSAKTIGIIGVVVGGLGLILAIVALARKRTA